MSAQSAISDRLIGGPATRCYVVAELGVNHNGDEDLATEMIRVAARCGADAVKVAAYTASEFTTDTPFTYKTHGGSEERTESQLAMFERLALSYDTISRLRQEARRQGLHFIVTATDAYWVARMDGLGVDAFKVGSDDIVHDPLLLAVRISGRPVILSTGMATREEIEHALSTQSRCVALLHCVSLYPTPIDKANLHRMVRLWNNVPVPVGYSDHTIGHVAATMAIGMGATVVEKHFTLDRKMDGPDHWFSATPEELELICQYARQQQKVVGSGRIEPEPDELAMRVTARRSIVAARDIPLGHVLTHEDLAYRRPGSGLWPSRRGEVLGKVTGVAVASGQQIVPSLLLDARELQPAVTH